MTVQSGDRAPDLSVVVVTHGGRELALATLASAAAATGDIEAEWIVVDNDSPDGTADAIRAAHPEALVIDSANHGFAAGNNVGLQRARGRYVLLLNPDVEIVRGTLAGLVAAMDGRPWVGLASVVQRGPDGSLQPSIRRFPTVLRDLGESLFAARWPVLRGCQEPETRTQVYTREAKVDWVVGAFLLARAEAVRDVGPMDDGYFLYSEEVDWCYRFARAGWEVRHLPLMTITHYAGRRDRGDLMAQLAYSRRRFAAKHYGRGRAWGIRGALALGHVLRIAALGPAAVRDREARVRMANELRALAVQVGAARPPVLGDAARTTPATAAATAAP